MSEFKKCFCDLYRECSERTTIEVEVGTDILSAGEFIEDADKICKGHQYLYRQQSTCC